jgi:hypothetical protein
MAVKIQIRGDLAATWTSVNPTPSNREFCLETDTQKLKIGDGVTAWTSLLYFTGSGIAELVEDLTPQLGGNLDMNGQNIQTVTPTEMAFISGVTSAIQTQLDAKASNAAIADMTTSDAVIGDDALVRGKGGSRGTQTSGITIDDNNRVSGGGTLFNHQVGTTYTLAASDDGLTVTRTNAAASTLTVPPDSGVSFPAGCVVSVLNEGAGTVTIGITDDTLNQKDSKFDLVSGAICTLLKTGSTTWRLFGELE